MAAQAAQTSPLTCDRSPDLGFAVHATTMGEGRKLGDRWSIGWEALTASLRFVLRFVCDAEEIDR